MSKVSWKDIFAVYQWTVFKNEFTFVIKKLYCMELLWYTAAIDKFYAMYLVPTANKKSGSKMTFVEGAIIKGTVMQIEKALINDRLSVSKISWKFRIPAIYNFAVICPWNLRFSLAYFLTVSIVFSVYKHNFTAQ